MKTIDARGLPKFRLFAPGLLAAVLAIGACASHGARAAAQTSAPAPAVISHLRPVATPAYDSDRGIMRASTREAYEAAVADQHFAFEQFTYQSDGLTVGAYLFRPRETQARLPVVVFNRGGWVREDFGPETLVQARRFNEVGFIVIAPWLRGSNGTEGRDEMGGADLNDLMNIVAVIRALPDADPDRVFLLGESRGSMMTFQALRDGFPARAAVTYGSWGDLTAMIEAQPQAAAHIWPDLAQTRETLVARRSALQWIDRINAPVLLLHGAEDGDTPVEGARLIDAALERAGKTHELRIFDGAHHTLQEVAADRDAAAIAWLQRFDAR
jgi:dipeptidyl aminopeptidase/acylaminoacyl peptidase